MDLHDTQEEYLVNLKPEIEVLRPQMKEHQTKMDNKPLEPREEMETNVSSQFQRNQPCRHP